MAARLRELRGEKEASEQQRYVKSSSLGMRNQTKSKEKQDRKWAKCQIWAKYEEESLHFDTKILFKRKSVKKRIFHTPAFPSKNGL